MKTPVSRLVAALAIGAASLSLSGCAAGQVEPDDVFDRLSDAGIRCPSSIETFDHLSSVVSQRACDDQLAVMWTSSPEEMERVREELVEEIADDDSLLAISDSVAVEVGHDAPYLEEASEIVEDLDMELIRD